MQCKVFYRIVKFFTGISKEIPETPKCPIFDQYLLALIKLQLNVGDKDVAFRFGISQASVSRYISKWLDVLSSKLSTLA